MTTTTRPVAAPAWDLGQIVAGGERVVHLWPNDCFKAHLSIYHFAARFCQGGYVLDAGSGSGYGAAYLADHGAEFVYGVDISSRPVAFSRDHFPRPNLQYHVMDLQRIWGFSDQFFDLVVSSNALEHIPDVPAFFHSAWRLIKQDGNLIVVVPPITNEAARDANLDNRYHLNIWSPRQWHHTLGRYFADIQCYRHGYDRNDQVLDFGNRPSQTKVSEADFTFEPIALDQFDCLPTYSAIFVARRPLAESVVPPKGAPLTFIDDSFTRPAPPPDPEEAQEDMAAVQASLLARIKRTVKYYLPWTVPVYRFVLRKKCPEPDW